MVLYPADRLNWHYRPYAVGFVVAKPSEYNIIELSTINYPAPNPIALSVAEPRFYMNTAFLRSGSPVVKSLTEPKFNTLFALPNCIVATDSVTELLLTFNAMFASVGVVLFNVNYPSVALSYTDAPAVAVINPCNAVISVYAVPTIVPRVPTYPESILVSLCKVVISPYIVETIVD